MKKRTNILIIIGFALIISVVFVFYFINNNHDEISEMDVTIKNNIDDDIDWDELKEYTLSLTESVTISKEGVYTLSGDISDGYVKIDTSGNVKLIFDGVTITNDSGPALFVENASLVLIELSDNSVNTLSDGESYHNYEDDVEGAIFSRDNLVIDGSGELILNGNKGDALVSKDSLKINDGNFSIKSVDDGVRGKDAVIINGGVFKITVDGDGIKSTNDNDSSLGYIQITGGTFNITSSLDGFDAETKVIIDDGEFNITTGGGSVNSSDKSSWGSWKDTSDGGSAKGIIAGKIIVINDGEFNLNTSDDGIHSNEYVQITGGNMVILSGDDGIHADTEIIIDNGDIIISKSYEGIEAESIVINNGNISIVASDDGINGAGGNDSSAMNRPGENTSNYAKSSLTINNGIINVSSSGDGIDVNGSIYLNGGYVVVNGPVSNDNGALDYDNEFKVTGGTVIASGSSGMAQGISSSSSQYGVMVSFTGSINSDNVVTIVNSSDEEILSYTSTKNYNSLVFSSDKLKKGEEYAIKIDGEEYTSFTVNSISTGVGNGNNFYGGPENRR